MVLSDAELSAIRTGNWEVDCARVTLTQRSPVGSTHSGGSTPTQLATRQTGRGGSGSAEAKAEQREIVRCSNSTGRVADQSPVRSWGK